MPRLAGLRPLIDDPGHQVALLACEIGIKLGVPLIACAYR
jgi:hypothetical protein